MTRRKDPMDPPGYARHTNRRPSNSVTRKRRKHIPFRAQAQHMAQNLIRQASGKESVRLRRKAAAWDDDYLASPVVT